MISCIICSKNKNSLNAISANIAETIGVPYELIAIDNANGDYGICAAYNSGAAKANYDLICFVHEDVLFHTQGWGVNSVQHFMNDPMLGVIGVAGSTVKTKSLSSWWQRSIGQYEPKRKNMIQQYKFEAAAKSSILINPYNESCSEVVTLDGVFMLTKKNIWNEFNFDEEMLKGFHCYDMDFTLQVRTKYKIAVVFDILLEHFSEGKKTKSYFLNLIAVHQKHEHKFPILMGKPYDRNFYFNELIALLIACRRMNALGLSKRTMGAYLRTFPAYFFSPPKKIVWFVVFVFKKGKSFLKRKLLHKFASHQMTGME